MIQVRKNVFETNSSSTHSLVMAEKSEFDKWEKGEVLYCNCWWSSKDNRFEEGKTNEDILFLYEIFRHCQNIVHFNEGLYLYRINEEFFL